MKVAAVQFKGNKLDPAGSLRELAGFAAAAGRDADLVVLPEMAATGYLFDGPEAVRTVAEPEDGPTFRVMSMAARQSGAWVVCGFPERAGDRLFNSAMVVNPRGEHVFTYRKTLLFTADLPWASEGDSGYRRIDTDVGSFGVGICMDLNDDRFVRWCGREGLDAIVLPTNWVDEGEDVWSYWAWRIRDLTGSLVAANTWGAEELAGEQTRFSGESAVIRGRAVVAAAPKTGNGWIEADLSATPPGAADAP